VKAQTTSLRSTQLAIRIIHNTHVGRVRRVHVRSETVHPSAELAAGVAQIDTVSSSSVAEGKSMDRALLFSHSTMTSCFASRGLF